MAADVELAEVYERALRKLRVVALNEAPSAEDIDVCRQYYPGVWAMLEGRGIVAWGEEDPIPQRYVLPVIDLLAERCAADFGKAFGQEAAWAIPELTRQIRPAYTHDTVRFFDF